MGAGAQKRGAGAGRVLVLGLAPVTVGREEGRQAVEARLSGQGQKGRGCGRIN